MKTRKLEFNKNLRSFYRVREDIGGFAYTRALNRTFNELLSRSICVEINVSIIIISFPFPPCIFPHVRQPIKSTLHN